MLDVRFSADYIRFSPKSGRIDEAVEMEARARTIRAKRAEQNPAK